MWKKGTTTTLRIDSTSIELARVIARASTTIPMRLWSAGSESALLVIAATSMDTGGDSGDNERADLFLRSFDVGCTSASVSTAESAEGVSTLGFLESRTSTPPIDRRFTDVLEVASTSVRSDSGVDCLVSSSCIGDDERHVKGEERREGDGDRDLERDAVRDADRFGVGDIDKGLRMTGDGGVTSGTVTTGSPSQVSGMSVWSEDMSSS